MDTPTNRLGRCSRIFSMGTAGLVLLGSLIGVLGTLVLPSIAYAHNLITLVRLLKV